MERFDINLEQAMELLNLKPGFTETEFRNNYINLMKNIHPDTLGDINEVARKIIEDEVKRVNIAKEVIESFLKNKSFDSNAGDNNSYSNNEEQKEGQRKEKEQQERQKKEKEQQERQKKEKEHQERQKKEKEQKERQEQEDILRWKKHAEEKEQQAKEELRRKQQEQQERQRKEKEQQERQKKEKEQQRCNKNTFKKIINVIPGFRTGSKWKMVLAIIYYAFCLLMITTGIKLFLFYISIPFFIFNLIKSIKTKAIAPIITTIISLIIFIIGLS